MKKRVRRGAGGCAILIRARRGRRRDLRDVRHGKQRIPGCVARFGFRASLNLGAQFTRENFIEIGSGLPGGGRRHAFRQDFRVFRGVERQRSINRAVPEMPAIGFARGPGIAPGQSLRFHVLREIAQTDEETGIHDQLFPSPVRGRGAVRGHRSHGIRSVGPYTARYPRSLPRTAACGAPGSWKVLPTARAAAPPRIRTESLAKPPAASGGQGRPGMATVDGKERRLIS